MAELRKCPFCGGEARIDINVALRGYRVACKSTLKCGAMFEWYDTEKEAIEAWNTRKPMEAVVAKLNETGRKFCENVGCNKDCENCEHGALMRTIVEIARGKERKYCGNCKHQPEPLTTCDWLKSQTVVIKECPRWEGKE